MSNRIPSEDLDFDELHTIYDALVYYVSWAPLSDPDKKAAKAAMPKIERVIQKAIRQSGKRRTR